MATSPSALSPPHVIESQSPPTQSTTKAVQGVVYEPDLDTDEEESDSEEEDEGPGLGFLVVRCLSLPLAAPSFCSQERRDHSPLDCSEITC